MAKGLAEATAAEESAIKSYDELMAAKTKEVTVLTAAIETKMERIGSLGVAIVQMQNDLGDTEEALIADKEFLANLDKSCATKTAEWDEIVKTRADELAALADTIKVQKNTPKCSVQSCASQGEHLRAANARPGRAQNVDREEPPGERQT